MTKMLKNVASCLLFCGLAPSALVLAATPDKIEFNQHIRPILSDNCFQCHGPDAETREADLRLDTAAGIIADLGGYQAVVPGDPDKSELYLRIIHNDAEERMPLAESNKSLSTAEIDLLRQWIAEGAEWQQHWSFEPIKKRAAPSIVISGWTQNAIDAFIARKLAEADLEPSPQADKRTMARRLALDLTGLPPTLATVEAFVADTSEQAYENLVDQLLATQDFGEHRAHYWLDAARYADTHGLHLDNYRSIWPYRDWVVDAFNSNMPFDQFTVEQLAGDLLENPTTEQLVATGFNRSNATTSEGGAIDEEYLAIYAGDRTETTSTVWMGLTLGCARCHDHKFDPLKQSEFYQFAAFFRNTTQPAMDGNRSDSPPYLLVPAKQDAQRKAEIQTELATLRARFEAQRTEASQQFEDWSATDGLIDPAIPVATSVLEFSATLSEGNGVKLTGESVSGTWRGLIEGDHQWSDDTEGASLAITNDTRIELPEIADFNLNDRFSVSFWMRLPAETRAVNPIIGRFDNTNADIGWKVSTTGAGSVLFNLRGDADTSFYAYTKQPLKRESWQHVSLIYNGSGAPGGLATYINGELVEMTSISAGFGVSDFNAAEAVPRGLVIGGQNAADVERARVEQEQADQQSNDASAEESSADEIAPIADAKYLALRDIRIFNNIITNEDIRQLYRAPQLRKAETASSNLREDYYFSQIAEAGVDILSQSRKLRGELAIIDRRSTITLIMEEKADSIAEAYILNRGEYDQPGEKVAAGVPSVFSSLPTEQIADRLALANWLVDPAHPLTARVTVNRFWQELFGTGLVETAEDFGSQGSPPSHPELLDWLATEFIESDWDIKQLFKLMVMSATYRQESIVSEQLREVDPNNRLLARGPRYRLDAEVIRDQALQLSGLLVNRVGGPPVKPYQPDGIWRAVGYSTSNTVQFSQDHGEDLYRKSLYTFQKRTAAPPSMAVFDAASRQSHAVRRSITNTPMQALVLLNDPQYVEAARNLAQRVLLAETGNRFAYLLENTLLREPDQEMIAILENTYADVNESYRNDPEAAAALLRVGESDWDQQLDEAELATWTILASQILSLDELITKH
ncbi:MAG TPA: hypothetical protein DCS33_05415 [Gammaproteobacteria bacterium]|nr:hypothetical protein [Gammaproteobacteria bacterium]